MLLFVSGFGVSGIGVERHVQIVHVLRLLGS